MLDVLSDAFTVSPLHAGAVKSVIYLLDGNVQVLLGTMSCFLSFLDNIAWILHTVLLQHSLLIQYIKAVLFTQGSLNIFPTTEDHFSDMFLIRFLCIFPMCYLNFATLFKATVLNNC